MKYLKNLIGFLVTMSNLKTNHKVNRKQTLINHKGYRAYSLQDNIEQLKFHINKSNEADLAEEATHRLKELIELFTFFNKGKKC